MRKSPVASHSVRLARTALQTVLPKSRGGPAAGRAHFTQKINVVGLPGVAWQLGDALCRVNDPITIPTLNVTITRAL